MGVFSGFGLLSISYTCLHNPAYAISCYLDRALKRIGCVIVAVGSIRLRCGRQRRKLETLLFPNEVLPSVRTLQVPRHVNDNTTNTPGRTWHIEAWTKWLIFCRRYQWLSARLQYLQCFSNGDTAVLHLAIDTMIAFSWMKSIVIRF